MISSKPRPGDAHLERARRLLRHEGATGGAAACADAAARVYDRLHAQLQPLLGAAGVQALFVRSAQLARRDLGGRAQAGDMESAARLRACLQALEPAAAIGTAEGLSATFFALITTFIGERLTSQVLRSAWPAMEEPPLPENEK